MGENRCGIQEPIEIKNLITSELEAESRTEDVMDAWITLILKKNAENTRCPEAVLRREVNRQIYRYQAQYASENQGFGFGKHTVEEDLKKNVRRVVVLKQKEKDSREYNYWTWKWTMDPDEDKLHADFDQPDGKATERQTFKNWTSKDRAVVTTQNVTCMGVVTLP